MDAEEFLPRMEVEELLQRYATGERDFRLLDMSGADLSGVPTAVNNTSRLSKKAESRRL